ncbi:MAG: N-acetylmuramoyl-L-alanine amidase, partial [Bryobacteraceae bacterium]
MSRVLQRQQSGVPARLTPVPRDHTPGMRPWRNLSAGRRLWLEKRADSIRDPAARLRFLRRVLDDRSRRRWPLKVRSAYLAMLGLLVLAPRTTLTRTAGLGVFDRSGPEGTAGAAAIREPMEREPIESVWLVESAEGQDEYSNGLRIDTNWATRHELRRYPVFSRHGPAEIAAWSTDPVGIVFHTTESHIAPFDQAHNARLRRVGRWMLDYVRRQRAYHFVIDRFGRVHRVVAESDAADHAGLSVWADHRGLYVNLNRSFFGVAFEAGSAGGAKPALTPAQVHAAKQLTQWLRSRYGIPAVNCVAHAQVSVAPAIGRIANHLDWASGFPFEEVGLPDNYGQALPAIFAFGFGYDADLLGVAGARLWKGLALADDQLRQDAA